jgi:drug/metabolite transporter (DMT)-like permease
MRRLRPREALALAALLAGAICATSVGILIVHALREPDDDTVRTLVLLIAVSAVAAVVAAVPALRHPATRPVALEGVEMAFVGAFVLGVIAFFVYVVYDGYR